ncbi:uncharacterized protein MELLADRAFT_102914 [Melampsora larici-populina 98AG31]|uniref:LYC1 C-terminal domain-containing protein n=1 Tax=Melampsora larici-populina (strain 98AG31 / pathotype 3-4-7) TaxID=747676 RepID=F4R8K8_MELLP|nr:uncharacterized protein MELLADRAFT_102914 [Melampsora larici-populina 98AG31]EGG11094.1 hypothetical protein MELLADRAFT_102914 [Melampsora larici-populina 98AG31]
MSILSGPVIGTVQAKQATNYDHLILIPASREQYLTSLSSHASLWGSTLTEEQYLKREEVLSMTEACRDARSQCWVLVSKDAPDSLDYYCSCETMKREVICAIGSRQLVPPKPLAILPAYSICSVFCPPHHRGKGYTRHMMRLLHFQLASPDWLATQSNVANPNPRFNDAILSVLYSDIGPEFYAKATPPGWQVTESLQTVWTVDDLPVADGFPTMDLKPIRLKDFKSVAESDSTWLHQELSKENAQKSAWFAFRPDGADLEWLITRSNFYANILRESSIPDLLVVDIWGYQKEQDDSEFITWYIDYPAETLYLARVRCQPEDSIFFKVVFNKVVELAKEQRCKMIKCWNIDSRLVNSLGFPSQTQPRTDSLSAVAWYGETIDHLEWFANEKLFWC